MHPPITLQQGGLFEQARMFLDAVYSNFRLEGEIDQLHVSVLKLLLPPPSITAPPLSYVRLRKTEIWWQWRSFCSPVRGNALQLAISQFNYVFVPRQTIFYPTEKILHCSQDFPVVSCPNKIEIGRYAGTSLGDKRPMQILITVSE